MAQTDLGATIRNFAFNFSIPGGFSGIYALTLLAGLVASIFFDSVWLFVFVFVVMTIPLVLILLVYIYQAIFNAGKASSISRQNPLSSDELLKATHYMRLGNEQQLLGEGKNGKKKKKTTKNEEDEIQVVVQMTEAVPVKQEAGATKAKKRKG